MIVPVLLVDKVNKNNRIYPKHVMDKEIERCKTEIESNRLLCLSDNQGGQFTDITKIIGKVNRLNINGDNLEADIEFLNVGRGPAYYEELIKSGKFGVRSTGMGRLEPDDKGAQVVQDGFYFTHFFITPLE